MRRMPWAPAIKKASTDRRRKIIVTTTVYLGRFAILLQVVATSALLMSAASKVSAAANGHQQPSPNSEGSGNTSTALDTLNPWLSACDLVQPNTDLQGTCVATPDEAPPPHGPGPPDARPPPTSAKTSAFVCPHECPERFRVSAARHDQNVTNQCLYYLHESHKNDLCGRPIQGGGAIAVLRTLRLRHCCEHNVVSAMTPEAVAAVKRGGPDCRRHLDAVLDTDAMAARISCEFNEVLTRYDCGQNYSIVHHCGDCKQAYRRWVCSSLVPVVLKGKPGGERSGSGSGSSISAGTDGGGGGWGRAKPCRSVCQTVEQQCPYFLPGDRAPAHPTQYAGEPTFLCLDPNIPETGKQKEKSNVGTDNCCYSYSGTPGRPDIDIQGCKYVELNETWPSQPVQCTTSGQQTVATSSSPSRQAECRLPVYHSSAPAFIKTPNNRLIVIITILIPLNLVVVRTLNNFLISLLVCFINFIRTNLNDSVKWKKRIVK